jgi:hypothetical protein
MKKIFLLAALFTAAFSVSAQQKADEVIKVDMVKHDFGKIKQGAPVTTFFVITNTSDKPIFIENATAGCGCTTPEFSKEPIAPNATSKVKVGYNAAAMGHFDKDVSIKIAGFTEPKVIKITGEVVPTDAAASAPVKATEPIPASAASPIKTTKPTTPKKSTSKKS